MSFTIPDEVIRIAKTLREANHAVWAVGGAVRDSLLGHETLDWDLTTSARPQQVQALFRRTIPVGIDFGTVGVLDRDGVLHEVTTFRKDVHTDGRHAVVEFGASLDDDLARRDFTINAIALDPLTGEVRDPFDGRTDLKRGIVRAVGDAPERMREDRLRALRAIRFAARFGFHIEPATMSAIRDSAPHLTRLSAERVKQELEKTMQQVAKPSIALEWWRECGALATLVPAIAKAPPARFRALDLLPIGGTDAEGKGATINRLAMLFIGETPGVAEHAARALKFSNADISWIVSLTRAEREVGHEVRLALGARAMPDGRTLRGWLAKIGRTRADTFFELMGASVVAERMQTDGGNGKAVPDEALVAHAAAVRKAAVAAAYRDPIEVADLAIDGDDLRRLGVKPGPKIGKLLGDLLEAVIEDPAVNTVTGLEGLVKEKIKDLGT